MGKGGKKAGKKGAKSGGLLGFGACVITVSDRSSAGERPDHSGPRLEKMLRKAGYDIEESVLVPDDEEVIATALQMAVRRDIPLVVTTGGTGFTRRDVTPEATARVVERRADALADEMRRVGRKKTKYAPLSRGICGLAAGSLIINLPGSPKGAAESLEAILEILPHALGQLRGSEGHDDA